MPNDPFWLPWIEPKSNRKMIFGSLFSGIGGLDLGLERAGWECKWQVENNDFCRKVLEKHWPDVPKFGDVKRIRTKDLEWVDLVCGGFPCQPVSVAGKRQGIDDERWLWPEFARIIRMVRPTYALIENVPGLLTANNGRAMSEILGDLAESGYDAEWDCVSAESVGAPHLRWRVFIVAYGRRWGRNGIQPNGQPWSSQEAAVGSSSQDVADASVPISKGGARARRRIGEHKETEGNGRGRNGQSYGQWSTEPNVGRVAHGVPSRVARLKSLGNAVVPQVVEWIGRMIIESDRS